MNFIDMSATGKGLIGIGLFFLLAASRLYAQSDSATFRNDQLGHDRVSTSWRKYDDTLSREFHKRGLAWPPKDIFLRAFKNQNELELWARNNESSEYRLVKTYHICSLSGSLGPKRSQGDRQVPEGFYFIDEFNPSSQYYLSLKLNYPNYSDLALGSGKLGGDIYIHGGCVTVGCLPMTDEGIKEIYTLCLNARLNGEENIPVHIYPTRLTKSGMNYLYHEFPKDLNKQQFWSELKTGYDYFEKTHRLLPVMYTPEGRYAN